MFDHQAQRKANQQATQLRSMLYREGQRLEGAVNKANSDYRKTPSKEHKTNLIYALGKLSGYLVSRNCLSPTIGADQAMQSQAGLIKKLSQELGLSQKINRWVNIA